MIEVMVADDNIELNSLCCKFLTKDKNIKIVSSTTDGEKTFEEYNKLKPDLLLLDLDMPRMNGLEIINQLSKDPYEKQKCNIIVISGNASMRYDLLNTAKIYKIIPKPVDLQNVLDDINLFASELSTPQEVTPKKIRDLLCELNIQPYSKSGKYVFEALEIVLEDPYILENIKDLYYKISKKNNVSYNTVKWGIRNSISLMNRLISIKNLRMIFRIYDNERNITPKYFFTMILEYFGKEY